jgi:gluconate 2-dehydrogenase gamma chain
MSQLSRREFFLQGTVYGSSIWMLLNMPRPRALQAAQESTRPEFFTEAEWKTIEAITGRIIPTDHEPGAIEAGCVNFIDKALAHEDAALQPVYRGGIGGVDAVSQRRFEKSFVALSGEQQDEVLAALESGKADDWPGGAELPAPKFFEVVRTYTIIGFLADPKYGGNRDYAGWKVVGYPGGGHHIGGYSPAQMIGKDRIKTAWGEEV